LGTLSRNLQFSHDCSVSFWATCRKIIIDSIYTNLCLTVELYYKDIKATKFAKIIIDIIQIVFFIIKLYYVKKYKNSQIIRQKFKL